MTKLSAQPLGWVQRVKPAFADQAFAPRVATSGAEDRYGTDMRTAVIRVMIDPDGLLPGSDYEAGVKYLESLGLEVMASPVQHLPERQREIELIVDGHDRELRAGEYVDLCSKAFGTQAVMGVVTYISRGTDDDARGILSRFGVRGEVVRTVVADEELVTITVDRLELGHVPESRLHTALEAALNCEVRIELS